MPVHVVGRPRQVLATNPPDPDPGGGSVGGATPTGPAASGATVSYAPTVVAKSATEIQNPGRGLFYWNRSDMRAPQPVDPPPDLYERDQITWRDLEPVQGQYNLAKIEAGCVEAKSRGGRYGFRLAIVDMPQPSGGNYPDYLKGGSYGGYAGFGNWVPDWNNNAWLGRVEALWAAIGVRYGKDPRIGMMDIGMYGRWGEWHLYQVGGAAATFASLKRIIDCQVAALPNADWVQMYGNADVSDAVHYAMGLKTASGLYVGWRNDAAGHSTQGFAHRSSACWAQTPNPQSEQWKRAPNVAEVANITPTDGTFDSGTASWGNVDAQVKSERYSMVSNGNTTAPFSAFSADRQQAWLNAGKDSGYRYELRLVTVPDTVEAGSHFTLRSEWVNVGAAPCYRPWQVRWLLKTAAGVVVWTGISTLDLRGLLPSAAATVISENFNMPGTLTGGTHTLCVQVWDAGIGGLGTYFKPMALPVAGRAADGAYPLRPVTVPAAGSGDGGITGLAAPAVSPAVAGTGAYLRTVGSPTRLKLLGVTVWPLPDYISSSSNTAVDQYTNFDVTCGQIAAAGGNCVRVRILADEYQVNGYMPKVTYVAHCVNIAAVAATHGLYVIFCAWDALDSQTGKNGSAWPANAGYTFPLITAVVQALRAANGGADPPMVVWEPANEPNGVSWDEWLTGWKTTVGFFRTTLAYQGLLIADSRQWSHDFGVDAATRLVAGSYLTQLEDYDAARLVAGKPNVAFARHDYPDDYAGSTYSNAAWQNMTMGGASDHVLVETEFGKYNNGVDTPSWGAAAVADWKAAGFARSNWAGFVGFIWYFRVGGSPDANSIVSDVTAGTPTAWGANVLNLLGG